MIAPDLPEPASVNDVRALARSGTALDYVFFWRPDAVDPSVLGPECFSQWHASRFARRCALACVVVAMFAALARAQTTEIKILHINDQHGVIEPIVGTWMKPSEPSLIGGPHALESAIQKERAANPQTLFVNAGDWFQGAPEGEATEGAIIIDLMNALGCDLSVVGNHDFDLGLPVLQRLLGRARFPVLGTNVLDATTNAPWAPLKATLMKDVGDVRIGFAGVCTSDTPLLTLAQNTRGLRFEREEAVVRSVVLDLRKNGANIVVLVNHLGVNENIALADLIDGIDVIIGGHWHEGVSPNGRRSKNQKTLIAQAGPFCMSLGVVTMTIDAQKKRLVEATAKHTLLTPVESTEAPLTSAVLDRYRPILAAALDGVIADDAPEISGKRTGAPDSSALGRTIAATVRKATGADVAILAAESTGIGRRAGPITGRTIFESAHLATDSISIIDASGQDIADILKLATTLDGLAIDLDGIMPTFATETSVIVGALTRIDDRMLDRKAIYRVALSAPVLEKVEAVRAAAGRDGVKPTTFGELRAVLRTAWTSASAAVPLDPWRRLDDESIVRDLGTHLSSDDPARVAAALADEAAARASLCPTIEAALRSATNADVVRLLTAARDRLKK